MTKGWHQESERHSQARRNGYAGGSKPKYANMRTSEDYEKKEVEQNTAQKYERIPIDEVIRRNQASGRYFFSSDAKRFFKSRWDDIAYKKGTDVYFITSEKNDILRAD